MNFSKVINDALFLLLNGFKITLWVTFWSLLIALVIGLLTCIMSISKSKILNCIARFYLWLIRGTPLLVQGFVIYFAIPQALQAMGIDFMWSRYGGIFTVAVIALALNAGAYISEIFRSGILAVPKGQMEAARSLGLSKTKAMIKVVLPQAFKIAVPSLVNQFIITLKDTSILTPMGLKEIVYHSKNYVSSNGNGLATWLIVAVFYLVVVTVLTVISHAVERRMNYAHKG